MADISAARIYNMIMTAACLDSESSRRFLNTVTSSLPLDRLTMARIITATVVVFIPPAVEPGLQPMSINIIARIQLESDSVDISIVFIPAVLVVADIKHEERSFLDSEYPSRLL